MGEYDRTGTGVTPLAGGGTHGFIYTKTGATFAPLTGGGTETPLDQPAVGVTRQWQRSIVGSGVWTDIEHETGLTYVVSTDDKGCFLRIVEYDRNFLGYASAASDATEAVYVTHAGLVVAPFAGAGMEEKLLNKAGIAVTDFDATGPGGDTRERTGFAFSVFTGKGANVIIYAERGTGILERTGSGHRGLTKKTGTGISSFSGGGVEQLN